MEQRSTPVRLTSRPDGRQLARDISESLGKLPPQVPDIEQAVLGAILLEKNAIVEVASILRPEHFYSDQHKEVYKAIQQMFAAGTPIDMRTAVMELRRNGKLEIVGGAYYIAELTSKVSSAANVEHHSRIILEMAMKRDLIMVASQMHHDAYEDTTDVFSLLEKINLDVQAIFDGAIGTRSETELKEVCYAVIREVESRQTGKHTGIDSGYKELDVLLNGFNPTDLIIEAARPGMGKTAFALQAGKQIAERGDPVGVFSLEMSAKQLVERLACAESEIESDKVKKGILTPYEWERFMGSMGYIAKLPLYIDDSPFMTIVELRARAMRMKTKYGIKLLIIDYLQLIKGMNELGRNSTRDQEIGMITRTLKGIAKELEIPVICLSQLSRAVEQRGGVKRPQLSDLRESGAIEQDADVVIFLYRPEYYKITEDSDGYSTQGLCEVIIDKNRHGALDTAKLKFIGKFTKFTTWVSDYSTPTVTERQVKGVTRMKDPTEQLKDQEQLNQNPSPDDDQPF